MTELRGLAQKAQELANLGVKVVAISVDDQAHAREVWEKVAEKKFTILSDPGVQVIRKYGLLHTAGHGGDDIALRTTFLIDPRGIEKWRRVSDSIPDIPTVNETVSHIKQAQGESGGVDKYH
jgi:peroxiredoxin